MIQTSEKYNRLISANNHWFECRVVVKTRDGAEVGIIGEDKIISMTTDSKLFSEATLSIGSCVASELDLVTNEPDFTIPRMARIEPQVKVKARQIKRDGIDLFVNNNWVHIDWPFEVYAGGEWIELSESFELKAGNSWYPVNLPYTETEEDDDFIPQGTYYVDTRQKDEKSKVITIHGYDSMMLMERPMNGIMMWQGSANDKAVVEAVAEAIGVTVDAATLAYLQGYSVPDWGSSDGALTARECMGYIAACYCGNWCITQENELRLVVLGVGDLGLPEETFFLIDENHVPFKFADGSRLLIK